MADKKVKRSTASEIAGELGRMQKVFEAFKDASEIANVLAGKEALERKLKSSITALEKEQKELDDGCENLAIKYEKKKDDLAAIDAKIQSATASSQAILRTAQQNANAEAAKIVGASEAALISLKKDIEEGIQVNQVVQGKILNARQELSDLNKRIEEVKANALKALA